MEQHVGGQNRLPKTGGRLFPWHTCKGIVEHASKGILGLESGGVEEIAGRVRRVD